MRRGFAALGVLNRSVGLAQLFCLKVAAQLIYAIYPILTRIEDTDGKAARVSSLVIQTVAWTTIPIVILSVERSRRHFQLSPIGPADKPYLK